METRSLGIIRGLIQAVATALVVVLLQGGGCQGCKLPEWNRGSPTPPKPLTSKAYFVVVEETAKRTPESAKVLMDMAYWQGLRSQGHEWIFYDKDLTSAISKGFVRAAEGTPLPVLLVLDHATGKVLKKLPLPTTTAGVDAVKKEVTGS